MTPSAEHMSKPAEFTGKHMLYVMLGAFGVIVSVNLLMASLAVGTFPGAIVKNSYVASQDYNQHLQAAKDRADLNWQTTLEMDDQSLKLTVLDNTGAPVSGLDLHGRAGRPASALDDIDLALIEHSPSVYDVPLVLAAGRWEIRLHGRDALDNLVVAISEDIWIENE